MAIDFNIPGLEELNKMLQELPAKIEGNIMRGALRAGQKVILDAAKANVPVKSGALRASIRIKTGSRRGKVSANVIAGNKEAYYAHMVEYGTAAHLIKPKSRKSLFFAGLAREVVEHPGARQIPFMRTAVDGNTPAALDAVAAYVAERIPKEIKKAGK